MTITQPLLHFARGRRLAHVVGGRGTLAAAQANGSMLHGLKAEYRLVMKTAPMATCKSSVDGTRLACRSLYDHQKAGQRYDQYQHYAS